MIGSMLAGAYPWIKALHIASVIAWMSGLLYLPRLFVYHAEEAGFGSDRHDLFSKMEYRLLRIIMAPALIGSWVFGLALIATPGAVDWAQIWPWAKALAVLALTWFHMWLARKRRELESGECQTTGKTFRRMNEFPAILMLIIVIFVVVKPF